MHGTRAGIWGLAVFLLLAEVPAPAIAVGNFLRLPNYKQLIADADPAKTLKSRLALVEPLQVSPLRPSILTQPGEWNACIKVVSQGLLPPGAKAEWTDAAKRSSAKGLPAHRPPLQGPVTISYYAIFFRDGKIAESRRSVVIDHCEQLQYSPLPMASRPKTDVNSDR